MTAASSVEVKALLALAKSNIPVDVQELLVAGNPMRGIPPHALRDAIAALQPTHAEEIDAGAKIIEAQVGAFADMSWGFYQMLAEQVLALKTSPTPPPIGDATAALQMIREAVEEFGPLASLESDEAATFQRGPAYTDRAAAIVEALGRLRKAIEV